MDDRQKIDEEEAKVKAEKEAAAKYKEENFIKPEDWNGPR